MSEAAAALSDEPTGAELRAWRKARGLSSQELAKALGVHRTTVQWRERQHSLRREIRLAVERLGEQMPEPKCSAS